MFQNIFVTTTWVWLTFAELLFFKLCAIFLEHRLFCRLKFAVFKLCIICSDLDYVFSVFDSRYKTLCYFMCMRLLLKSIFTLWLPSIFWNSLDKVNTHILHTGFCSCIAWKSLLCNVAIVHETSVCASIYLYKCPPFHQLSVCRLSISSQTVHCLYASFLPKYECEEYLLLYQMLIR